MPSDKRLTILSLGAGVQSTTIALMAAKGEITPMPDCAIFADTQWEPRKVYEHLDWLEKQLPFPVYRVTAGNIRKNLELNVTTQSYRFAAIPWFTLNVQGKKGMGRRQCTREYKLDIIKRQAAKMIGGRKGMVMDAVTMMIGISTDEASRMKDSRVAYIKHIFPLIERGMSRADCLEWLRAHLYPKAPKSACIGCPFHSDSTWRDMKENEPEEFADAVAADKLIRHGGSNGKMKSQQFMHRSCRPLDEVDFTNPAKGEINLFENECEGMCGV